MNKIIFFGLFLFSMTLFSRSKPLNDCAKGPEAFQKRSAAFFGLLLEACPSWHVVQNDKNSEAYVYRSLWKNILSGEKQNALPWADKAFVQKYRSMLQAWYDYNVNAANTNLEISPQSTLGEAFENERKHLDAARPALPGSLIKFSMDLVRLDIQDEAVRTIIKTSLSEIFQKNPEAFTKLLIDYTHASSPRCIHNPTLTTLAENGAPNYIGELSKFLLEDDEKVAAMNLRDPIKRAIETIASAGPEKVCLKAQLMGASTNLLNVLPAENQDKLLHE